VIDTSVEPNVKYYIRRPPAVADITARRKHCLAAAAVGFVAAAAAAAGESTATRIMKHVSLCSFICTGFAVAARHSLSSRKQSLLQEVKIVLPDSEGGRLGES